MTCDVCENPIEKGERYSITEHGRCHDDCQRLRSDPRRVVLGTKVGNFYLDPIYALRRA